MFKKTQAGQALLIVILLMVVGVTIGLAVASRSVINLKNTRNEEESQKAYSAAEAGVEQALKLKSGCSGTNCLGNNNISLGNNASIANVNGSLINSGQFLIAGGNPLLQDNGADIWFVAHNDSNNNLDYTTRWSGSQFTVFWGDNICDSTLNNVSALEVIIVQGDNNGANVFTKRVALDPCNTRRLSNNFQQITYTGTSTINGHTFYYKHLISITAGKGVFARVIPLYSSATAVGVMAAGLAIEQGVNITAKGVSGDTQRNVNVFKGYPQLPAEFFYTLLSPAKITPTP